METRAGVLATPCGHSPGLSVAWKESAAQKQPSSVMPDRLLFCKAKEHQLVGNKIQKQAKYFFHSPKCAKCKALSPDTVWVCLNQGFEMISPPLVEARSTPSPA